MRGFSFFLSLLCAFSLNAQQQITISGFITDAQSGEHLCGATLYELNSGNGIATNGYGFYSLTLPAGKIHLQVSYVGYQQHLKSLVVNTDTVISLSLATNNNVGEVLVKAPGSVNTSLHNIEHLPMTTVKALPGFLGENDVLKALAQFPGVQQGQEGSAGIFVRGGSPDQNLILLDGAPVYNASHLMGFLSVFNPEAIQSVDLYKGNFPARFGGRLSSVIDVQMKEGNMHKRHTDVTLGLISSKITHEGPIKKGKSSYFVSARRTLLDLGLTTFSHLSQIGASEKWIPQLSFYDVNAKLKFTLNPASHLSLSFYKGGDRMSYKSIYTDTENNDITITDDSQFHLKWGNSLFASRWNSQINKHLFMNASLSAVLFKYDMGFNFEQNVESDTDDYNNSSEVEYISKVNTNQLKVEFDWYPNKNHTVKFGSENALSFFIPGEQEFSKSEGGKITSGNSTEHNFTFNLFGEDHFSLNEKWKLDVGLRYDTYLCDSKVFQNISPRINIDYLLSEKAAFSLSWAKMFQPIHLLTNNSLGLPSDIWVPATTNTTPEKSSIVSLTGSFNFTPKLSLVSAAYYKSMEGVISYQSGYGFINISEDWESIVQQGKGRTWGLENALNYETRQLKCWANYTMSWNQRKFNDINNGNYFPYKYDRRHDINLGFLWKISPMLDFSATWVYQTGQAVSVAEQDYLGYPDLMGNSFYDFLTDLEIDDYDRIQAYSSYNNYRLPAFHHLDISLTKRQKVRNTTRELKLGVYNVYARQNIYLYYPYTNNEGVRKYKQVCIFPILPSISYRIIF